MPTRSATSGASGSRRCSCSPGRSFPSSQLPRIIQPVAWLLPLWHGVDLARALTLGTVAEDPLKHLIHVVFLVTVSVGRARAPRPDVPAPAASGPRDDVAHAGRSRRRWVALGGRRSLLLIERNLYLYRRSWMMLLSGFFEPLFYLLVDRPRASAASWARPGARRAAHPVPGVRRTGTARPGGDERRHRRVHVQYVLPAQLREGVRRRACDPARAGRRGARRDRLGADPRRPVLDRVRGRDAGARLVVLAGGRVRGARGDARRVHLRGRGHGRDDVHAHLAGLRPDPARHPAVVPVLGHVLSDHRVSRPSRRSSS